MKTIIHNKLVRDKIPDIIKEDNRECEIEFLSDINYLKELELKLDEEVKEYHQDQNIEELADILEVIYALVIAKGYSITELEKCRIEKKEKRGGFDKKIFLKEVRKQ